MEFILQTSLLILLVLLNGYFVASEFALVSVRKTRIEELAKKGNVTARLLKNALNELDSYISSTQLGITLASLGLGWIGEPALAKFIQPLLTFVPEQASFITAHGLAVTCAFIIITFLHIVLGELAPKTLALQRAEKVALIIIPPLVLFTRIFRPFIWILNGAGHLVLQLFGLKAPSDHQLVHSEEELKMLFSQSSLEGAIEKSEAEMVMNALTLGDISIKSIMVPRTDILAFNLNTPLIDIVKRIEKHPHSRFPVYEYTIDNIFGFIHVKDIYREHMNASESKPLAKLDIIRDIISVPENKKIDDVLQDMRKKRIHLAVVHDEFGGTAGIATLEDIIESLVGEIEDEFDRPAKHIVRQKDGSYLIDGLTLIQDVQEKFRLPLKGQGYTTIGGLVFGLLGREPRLGNSVQIGTLLLEVAEVKGKRITLLKLKKQRLGK
jgi:CBS domain containing-hemolysin-like protein